MTIILNLYKQYTTTHSKIRLIYSHLFLWYCHLGIPFLALYILDSGDIFVQPAFVPGKKISLRAYNERTDFEEYYKWINDKSVTEYMDDMYPVTYEYAKKSMRSLASPNLDNVVFIIEAHKEAVGITGLYDINDVHRRARTRTMIGEKEKFGRGYGTESKILLLSYAFYTINLHHITSIVQEQNVASIRSLTKVGCVREGLLRENSFYKGIWVNDIIFGITEPDFRPIWEKYNESLKK